MLKYLGIHNILNNTSKTQLDILSIDTQQVAIRIASRRASATVQAMVYNMYALARIRYGPHLTSSLDDMRRMVDKPIQMILRKISSNMTSFPTELLYGLQHVCPCQDTIWTPPDIITGRHEENGRQTDTDDTEENIKLHDIIPNRATIYPQNDGRTKIQMPDRYHNIIKRAIIHRAQLQSKHAASIAAGMMMRPQRHQ